MRVEFRRTDDDYPSWPATYCRIVVNTEPLVLAQVAGTGPAMTDIKQSAA
jgi:hypothetical protein